MDYDELNRLMWDRLADAWNARRAWNEGAVRPVTDWLLDQLALTPGQTLLELAAGNGETGLIAAARLSAGRVILTDQSPRMVETARRRGEELGLKNVEYRAMDAEHLPLGYSSVDSVVCRFGYMLMARREVAMAETRHVLRRGGRLAFSVWGDPQENPFFILPFSVLIDRGYWKPDPRKPNMFFTLAKPELISKLVTSVRFPEPVIKRVELRYRFEDADSFWSFMTDLAGPFAMTLAKLDERERATLRAATEERCAPFRSGRGFDFPAIALVAATSR